MPALRSMTVAMLLVGATACDQPVYEGCRDGVEGLLEPRPGELTIIQLRLNGSFKHGEAALVVGPDGTLVLIDVGNSSHSGEVRDALRHINTTCLTEERGYARARGELEVEWILLTHFHGDHAGGLEELLVDEPALDVTRGVVHRGFVDLGSGMNEGTLGSTCRLLRESHADLDTPLCSSDEPAPCDSREWTGAYGASACDGLLRGALDDDTDDALGEPSFIALGGGARLTMVGAGGYVSDGVSAALPLAFGHDHNNEENARSLVGIVEHGAFRYHFGGDLTGEGVEGVPDLETHLAAIAGPAFYDTNGVDVIHAHHHVRRTSSNPRFVDLVAPADGRSRNVVGGIAAHVGSPHSEVLARFGDSARLGEGRIWVTRTATGGDEHETLLDVDAAVVVRTLDGGDAYLVEASQDGGLRMRFDSVRR